MGVRFSCSLLLGSFEFWASFQLAPSLLLSSSPKIEPFKGYCYPYAALKRVGLLFSFELAYLVSLSAAQHTLQSLLIY